MKIIKPKFWRNLNIISLLLYPLSLITFFVNQIKKQSFKKEYSIKTICVGNLSVGGTGKTSLVIEMQKQLSKKNRKITIIKKKYSNQYDEISLIKKKGKLLVHKERKVALSIAQKKGFDLAIMDDGLQQKNIKYDLKIACFNSQEGFGNGLLLPAGPLRENLYELKNYDLAFINGEKKNIQLTKKLKSINKNLKIFEGKYQPINLKKLKNKKNYLMFCGIGNPQEFENTLEKYNFRIKKKIFFPDHYKISKKELIKIKKLAKANKLNIITTEKDYFRLENYERNSINYLQVNLKIKKIKQFKKFLNSKL